MTGAGAELAVAADVGGTFTDVVALDGRGRVETAKVLSSPPHFEEAVIRGLRLVLEQYGTSAQTVRRMFHGTTVATNALLEGRGSATALVTTGGFRDVLELTRGRRPSMYDLEWIKPAPLVPRRHRYELEQRITATGELDPPVDPDDLEALAAQLEHQGIESIAVCLINGFLRPDEERKVVAGLRERLPGRYFTASVELAPEAGEYERTSTAVVNAYVAPIVDSYLGRLEDGLAQLSGELSFSVMQSSGGLLPSKLARARSAQLIESGPAAGVIATRALARTLGLDNAIAFDMGGTTAKATLIERGEVFETTEFEVGAGMNARRGVNVGAGYPVRAASLDIAEVGAGGGSIFWIDSGGAPQVGPQSAGAAPGPACYGRGGEQPTLSDAKLLLGYLSPSAIAGGTQELHPELAEAAFEPVARELELSVHEAAYGAFQIAVANMTRLLKAVTSERGRDPRDSVLVGFGGAGPAYAAALAANLGIEEVLIPAASGLFSAVGLLASNPQHDAVRPYVSRGFDVTAISALFAEMEQDLLAVLLEDGYERDEIVLTRSGDMHYAGQVGKLKIPFPTAFDAAALEGVLDRLDEEHQRTYGHRKDRAAATLVNVRVRAECVTATLDPFAALASGVEHAPATTLPAREAYFGAGIGFVETPVLGRGALRERAWTGPLIVEEADATTVVPPGSTVRLDALGNMIIRRST